MRVFAVLLSLRRIGLFSERLKACATAICRLPSAVCLLCLRAFVVRKE
jgi:hypothetical protein